MTHHLARTTDPATSHEAAATTAVGVRGRVLEMIQKLTVSTPQGVSDAQIEQAYQSYAHAYDWPPASPQRLRTARKELVEAGRVTYTGNNGETRYGRRTQLWGPCNRATNTNALGQAFPGLQDAVDMGMNLSIRKGGTS